MSSFAHFARQLCIKPHTLAVCVHPNLKAIPFIALLSCMAARPEYMEIYCIGSDSTLKPITTFERNHIMENLLIRQLQEVMPHGMQIPEEIIMLYEYIESNGLYTDSDGCRYGFLYPEDKLQQSWKEYERDGKTIYERDGGTMITFAACGAANLKNWFKLDDNREAELRELEQRLCVFARTGCEDSQSAFWLTEQGDLKIVHMGSGSGSTLTCVLADNALDFIRLLAIGYDEICWDSDFPYPPDEIPYPDTIVKPNIEFQNWVKQTFHVEIPRTALEIVKHPARMEMDASEDAFFNWMWKF